MRRRRASLLALWTATMISGLGCVATPEPTPPATATGPWTPLLGTTLSIPTEDPRRDGISLYWTATERAPVDLAGWLAHMNEAELVRRLEVAGSSAVEISYSTPVRWITDNGCVEGSLRTRCLALGGAVHERPRRLG